MFVVSNVSRARSNGSGVEGTMEHSSKRLETQVHWLTSGFDKDVRAKHCSPRRNGEISVVVEYLFDLWPMWIIMSHTEPFRLIQSFSWPSLRSRDWLERLIFYAKRSHWLILHKCVQQWWLSWRHCSQRTVTFRDVTLWDHSSLRCKYVVRHTSLFQRY
jgi:hypothetical protein